MIPILGTVFAGLIGLAFGSFLNVCLTRWPAGESVIGPRSRCPHCGRTLTWWENVPVVSWVLLAGRCRSCRAPIAWRYPLVELSVGLMWALILWQTLSRAFPPGTGTLPDRLASSLLLGIAATVSAKLFFAWLLVGLAVLDAEHLWLPDFVTLPGIVLGGILTVWRGSPGAVAASPAFPFMMRMLNLGFDLGISAGLILLIRWLYWLIRRREGIGLGDAKLMALLAAWLGLPGALLAFAMGSILGGVVAAVVLIVPPNGMRASPAQGKLPLGAFLCLGGLIATVYGPQIMTAYLRWAGWG